MRMSPDQADRMSLELELNKLFVVCSYLWSKLLHIHENGVKYFLWSKC